MGVMQTAVRQRSSPLVISGTAPSGQSPLRYAGFVPTVNGGVPPYTFAVISGSVPNGTSFNTSTGAISSDFLEAGAYTATPTIRVTDAALTTRTLPLSIAITSSSSALTNATVNAGRRGVVLQANGAWFSSRPDGTIGEALGSGSYFSPNNFGSNGEAFDFFAMLMSGTVAGNSVPFSTWVNAATGVQFILNGSGSFSLEMRRVVDGVSYGSVIITVP